MKTHNVIIQTPQNTGADKITTDGWFKQTTSTGGIKTTKLFQREGGDKSRSLGQKISDFFSGIKRARNSVTLSEAFKGIKKFNNNTSLGGKFNENLIPMAIKEMAPREAKDKLDSSKPAQTVSHGKYTLKLEEM